MGDLSKNILENLSDVDLEDLSVNETIDYYKKSEKKQMAKTIVEQMGYKLKHAPVFSEVRNLIRHGRDGVLESSSDYFETSDVKNASPKFQKMLEKYQSLQEEYNEPSIRMHFRRNRLFKQAQKEDIKLYSFEEHEQILNDFHEKEVKRLDKWFANHPQAAKMVKEKVYPETDEEIIDEKQNKMTKDTYNINIDEVYDKVMEEAGLEK